MHDHETAKNIVDALSIGAVVGTLAGWLPAVAALLSIVWTTLRIYETRTIQNLLRIDPEE